MNNLFVFCIGGTGIRIMKSITMLLASGMNLKGYNLIPILIDPHQDLEERKSLDQTLASYQIINKNIYQGSDSTVNGSLTGFFQTEIKLLSDIDTTKNNKSDFSLQEQKSFAELIDYNSLSEKDINKQFIQLLYSESNLNNSLSVGFKGSPNVGSIVLSNLMDGSSWFNTFERNCKSNDKIFIISSIFGGTGASGFPVLSKKIKDSKNEDVKNALLGAITVLPYFGLENPETTGSSIDSANFITKTKSALSYYEKYIHPDYLYYIGDDTKQIYENNESKQDNQSHFIELVAATALFDFINKEKPEESQCLVRAIETDEEVLTYDKIGVGYSDLIKQISHLYIFSLLLDCLPEESQFPLKITRKLTNDNLYSTDAFRELTRFINGTDESNGFTTFIDWLKELAQSKRSFAPFNNLDLEYDGDDFHNLFKGRVFPKDISTYLLEMIKASNKLSKNDPENTHNNSMRYLMNFAYQGIRTVNNQKIN